MKIHQTRNRLYDTGRYLGWASLGGWPPSYASYPSYSSAWTEWKLRRTFQRIAAPKCGEEGSSAKAGSTVAKLNSIKVN